VSFMSSDTWTGGLEGKGEEVSLVEVVEDSGAGTVCTGEARSSSMLSSSGDSGGGRGAGARNGVARGFLPPLPLPHCLEDIRGDGEGTQLIEVIKTNKRGMICL
jgi:hypothetical protein